MKWAAVAIATGVWVLWRRWTAPLRFDPYADQDALDAAAVTGPSFLPGH